MKMGDTSGQMGKIIPILLKTLKEEKKGSVVWWVTIVTIGLMLIVLGGLALVFWFVLFRDVIDSIVKWF